MSNMTRWTRENWPATSFRDEMNRLFDDFLTPTALVGRERVVGWIPAMDVAETPSAVTVKLEVPGMKPEQIDIQVTGNVLTVKGEKKEEHEETVKNWHRVERSYGAFTRSVALPESVDAEKVTAQYDNGVLAIEIPKTEAAKPRQIRVTAKK